jgi:hypothetical protein
MYIPNSQGRLPARPKDGDLPYGRDPIAARRFPGSQMTIELTRCAPAAL